MKQYINNKQTIDVFKKSNYKSDYSTKSLIYLKIKLLVLTFSVLVIVL